jgi:hypothetical protein
MIENLIIYNENVWSFNEELLKISEQEGEKSIEHTINFKIIKKWNTFTTKEIYIK